MDSLASGADRAGKYKLSSVPGHAGPPKMLLEELDGASSPRVAGELRGVSPLAYSGASCLRNKPRPGVQLSLLSLLYFPLNFPDSGSYEAGGGSMGSGSSWDEGGENCRESASGLVFFDPGR